MNSTLLNLAMVANAAVVGALCGWWFRGIRGALSPEQDDGERSRLKMLMERLHQLAASMAADVGQHHSRVQEINDELSSVQDGSTEEVVTVVTKLIENNERMQQQLQDAEGKLEEQAQQIASHAEAAMTDALTGLANRRALDEELERCMAAYLQDGQPATILLTDVDHFKKFNDSHGHLAGDEVLRGVARVLRRSLAGHGCVARYGGEEFAVVFPGKSIKDVLQLGEAARRSISESRFRFEDLWLNVASSGGFAQLSRGESVADVIKRADEALYASKEAGRNCAHWHDGRHSKLVEFAEPQQEKGPDPTMAEGFAFPVGDTVQSLPSDVLQRVSNLQSLQADVDRRLAERKRGGACLSLMLLRLPDHEEVRQQYGPPAAQLLRRVVAQMTQANMRDMDHLGCGRDDCFVLLLPGSKLAGAEQTARRILHGASRRELLHQNVRLPLTLQVVVAEALTVDSSDALLGRTMEFLQTVPREAGNCGFVHDGKDCRPIESLVAASSV